LVDEDHVGVMTELRGERGSQLQTAEARAEDEGPQAAKDTEAAWVPLVAGSPCSGPLPCPRHGPLGGGTQGIA
jgi:hypothetical protein